MTHHTTNTYTTDDVVRTLLTALLESLCIIGRCCLTSKLLLPFLCACISCTNLLEYYIIANLNGFVNLPNQLLAGEVPIPHI